MPSPRSRCSPGAAWCTTAGWSSARTAWRAPSKGSSPPDDAPRALNQRLYGAALAVPLGLTTRVGADVATLRDGLEALARGRAPIHVVEPDPAADTGSGLDAEPVATDAADIADAAAGVRTGDLVTHEGETAAGTSGAEVREREVATPMPAEAAERAPGKVVEADDDAEAAVAVEAVDQGRAEPRRTLLGGLGHDRVPGRQGPQPRRRRGRPSR